MIGTLYHPMKEISILCENGDKKGLIKLISKSDIITELMPGKTEEEIADGFIQAHRSMRLQKDNPAFSKLNEMHDLMQKGKDNGKT
jgi:hypothetical protein